MDLLNELKTEFNTAIIMITHDLGVVAGSCDKVLVMYAGRTMEYGTVDDIFYNPSHPYAEGLLKAIPRLDTEGRYSLLFPAIHLTCFAYHRAVLIKNVAIVLFHSAALRRRR